MNVLFVIHTPRDERTAVYGGCLERKKYFENQGHPTEIWTPDDFGGVKSLGRLIPLFYPFFVAVRLLGRGHRGRHDAVLFHSYCGWAYFLLSKFYARTDRANAAVMFHGLEPLYYRALKEETARRGRRLSWRMRFFYGFLFVHMIRFSTRHAGKTFCLNREERDYLTGRGYVGENRCRQLANSVPEIFFCRA